MKVNLKLALEEVVVDVEWPPFVVQVILQAGCQATQVSGGKGY